MNEADTGCSTHGAPKLGYIDRTGREQVGVYFCGVCRAKTRSYMSAAVVRPTAGLNLIGWHLARPNLVKIMDEARS